MSLLSTDFFLALHQMLLPNHLPNISGKLKFFLFADDTNIYHKSDDLKEIEKT